MGRTMRWIEPSHFHPYWGAALLSRGSVRIVLVAVAVGVCAGAVVRTADFNRSATGPANQANLPISVQTETVKSQSFSAEPKATDPNLTELNELKAKIWEAELAQRNFAAALLIAAN
jgi:hypothetical protein